MRVPVFLAREQITQLIWLGEERSGMTAYAETPQISYLRTTDRKNLSSKGILDVLLCVPMAESFFSTLKNKLIHENRYATREGARSAIFEYIEVFYNHRRLHQGLNYRTPLQAEMSA